jgi:FkbM family methyltransferase
MSTAKAASVDTAAGQLLIDAEDTIMRPFLEQDPLWSPGLTHLVQAVLRPGMRFVDIGAHVGYFTVLAGKLVGPEGRVWAFEPHPRNFELLLANLDRNGIGNARCFKRAVTDKTGPAELFAAPGNTGDHRLYESYDEARRSSFVTAVALDDVHEIQRPVDFVKVDVQGVEEAALRGMRGLIEASPAATVVLEYWPYGIVRAGGDPVRSLAFFRSLGRGVRVLLDDGAVELDDEQILELCSVFDGMGHTDLVLTRP